MNSTITKIVYWWVIAVMLTTITLAIINISWLYYWIIGWALLFFLASFIILYKLYTRENNNETKPD